MRATADLYDHHGERLSSCTTQLRDLGALTSFAGPVRTLRVDDDNLDVREALSSPGAGAVLVVDNGGSLRVAMVGGNLAASAHANGWSGVIVNGAVRDVTELAIIDVGIKALGTNPARASKNGGGERDVPVEFGGVVFRLGAWVYADADGVVVAPNELE